MNKIIRSSKQVRADIKKFGLSSLGKAKGAIDDSIKCGLALLELKEITPRGEWESEFENAIGGVFGLRHAQKLMQIAAKKELLVLAPKDEILTINSAIEIITKASPEQIEEVKKIELERLAEIEKRAEQQRKADKAFKIAEQLEAEKKSQPLPEQSTSDKDPIEGDFKEVKPSESEPERPPEETVEQILTEANEVLLKDNAELVKEIESVTKILESNDQLAIAVAEAKKFRELNRVLNERITGLQNEKNEAIRSVKHWKNRAEKAEKELLALKTAV